MNNKITFIFLLFLIILLSVKNYSWSNEHQLNARISLKEEYNDNINLDIQDNEKVDDFVFTGSALIKSSYHRIKDSLNAEANIDLVDYSNKADHVPA